MKKTPNLGFLRTVALVVLLVGAGGSLDLTLQAGRNNHSVLLRVLFACWVLSPFIALLVANLISIRWSLLTRRALYFLMLVLTLGSLACYSGALSPPGTKPAFVFLIVPLISWLLLATVLPIAASRSRKRPTRIDRP
jgi:hypothetical protein